MSEEGSSDVDRGFPGETKARTRTRRTGGSSVSVEDFWVQLLPARKRIWKVTEDYRESNLRSQE